MLSISKWNGHKDFSGQQRQPDHNERITHYGNGKESPSVSANADASASASAVESSNGNPVGLNNNLPLSWNKENTERPTESGMYPYTSNERFTHQAPPINENTGHYDLNNRVPVQNEKPQNHQKCRYARSLFVNKV